MLQYFCVRLLLGILRWVPYSVQLFFFDALVLLLLCCSSRYRAIILTNLEIAFPDLSTEERTRLLWGSSKPLARTIADSLRVSYLKKEWFLENVAFPQVNEFIKALEEAAPRSVLCVGGHLGSFELLPSAAAAYTGRTGKVVARELKNDRLNLWWNDKRSAHGVEVINRSGALRKMLKFLKKGGGYLGVLYDQNVTRNLATFVDWFGLPAATTVAVGYCAVKVDVPIFVVTIETRPSGKYELRIKRVEVDVIRQDESLSFDEKVQAITQSITDEFIEFVRRQPESWFWMHRRWKTRPLEADPAVYPGVK